MAALLGCGTGKSQTETNEPVENPFAGLSVELAVPAEYNLPTDWQLPVSEWSVLHQAEAKLREYEVSDDAAAMVSSLGPESQVMLVPIAAVPELFERIGLSEIPAGLQQTEQLNWADFFPGLRERVAKISRKPRIVPVGSPVLVCYYREDLLEKAGLNPPGTWEDYQTLLETLNDWAPGLTAVEPWSESFRATIFLARSAAVAKHPEQLSFCFSLSDAQPLIANPGFVASLQTAKKALALMPAEVKTYSPGDCRREIFSGRAALAIGYETDLDRDFDRGENLQVGIAPLPGTRRVFNTSINEWVQFDEDRLHRVNLIGFDGWALAVADGLEPTLNSAAWELVRYMATDQLPTSYPAALVSLCRNSQTGMPSEWAGPQCTTLEAEQYATVQANALRSDQLVMEFPLIGGAQFRTALTQGLGQALDQAGNEEATLKAVQSEWLKIAEQLGKDKVVKSYQRSHD